MRIFFFFERDAEAEKKKRKGAFLLYFLTEDPVAERGRERRKEG